MKGLGFRRLPPSPDRAGAAEDPQAEQQRPRVEQLCGGDEERGQGQRREHPDQGTRRVALQSCAQGMPWPGGRQPVDALHDRGEVRDIRGGASAPEGLPQVEVPGQVQARAGETRDRRRHVPGHLGRHPPKDHGHQDRLQRRDDQDLDRDQKQRHREVQPGRASAGSNSQDAGGEDEAQQQVGSHGGHEPRHKDVSAADRRDDELQQVAADEERRDHGRKADHQHQQGQACEARGQQRVEGEGQEVAGGRPDCKSATAKESTGHEERDREYRQPRRVALQEPVASPKELRPHDDR